MRVLYFQQDWEKHPFYADILVSEHGIILSYMGKEWYELRQSDNGCGYLRVGVGHGNPCYVHRLVAEAWVYNPDPEILTEVNHADGYKYNNHFTNLEWVTRSQNELHARAMGLKKSYGRGVKVLETGRIYWSQAACARDINGIQGNIALCLAGKRNTHRGYHFEYWDEE